MDLSKNYVSSWGVLKLSHATTGSGRIQQLELSGDYSCLNLGSHRESVSVLLLNCFTLLATGLANEISLLYAVTLQISSIHNDFLDHDTNPFPESRKGVRDSHGTHCAGVVGMEKGNSKCGVGVAYNSFITGC